MTGSILLVGDIGGTNARFAIAERGQASFAKESTLKSADFDEIATAIDHYLSDIGAPAPAAICLAVAGPVQGQYARLTNNPWHISAEALSRHFSGTPVRLVNDFVAVAHAIPLLSPNDSLAVGPDPELSTTAETNDMSVGVLGPGTGLGVSALFRRNGYTFAIESEAGHAGFSPETPLQADLLRVLRERYSRVSRERLLSGAGLEDIYWAMHKLRRRKVVALDAATIFHKAQAGKDELAHDSVQVFFEILGQVSGDLALELGAVDGIYIGGGISPRYPQLLTESRFREAFENKGRHRAYMERIPTRLILHPNPGLLGASGLARESATSHV